MNRQREFNKIIEVINGVLDINLLEDKIRFLQDADNYIKKELNILLNEKHRQEELNVCLGKKLK